MNRFLNTVNTTHTVHHAHKLSVCATNPCTKNYMHVVISELAEAMPNSKEIKSIRSACLKLSVSRNSVKCKIFKFYEDLLMKI